VVRRRRQRRTCGRTAEFMRVDGEGRIVEHHRIFDTGSFMAQLGLA
jgi:hypothetical protein